MEYLTVYHAKNNTSDIRKRLVNTRPFLKENSLLENEAQILKILGKSLENHEDQFLQFSIFIVQ